MKPVAHSRPYVGKEECRAVHAVLVSGRLAGAEQLTRLEHELASLVGHRYGIGVSSGTAALYLSLLALGIGRGKEVVVPAYGCTALLNAVHMAGAMPRLADVDPSSGNLTAESVRKVLRKKTGAVIVPHMFGFPAHVAHIERLGVPVIEDCAQCVGATVQGKAVGGLSTISVFSFYATKILAAGEGGMIATSDRRIAAKLVDFREYDERKNYHPSFNFKLSDVHAAVALVQVRKLAAMVAMRRTLAREYDRLLTGTGIDIPVALPDTEAVYYRYVVKTKIHPVTLIARLGADGIECRRPVFKPLSSYLGLRGFPATERMYRQALSLPLYPGLTKKQVASIARRLSESVCR